MASGAAPDIALSTCPVTYTDINSVGQVQKLEQLRAAVSPSSHIFQEIQPTRGIRLRSDNEFTACFCSSLSNLSQDEMSCLLEGGMSVSASVDCAGRVG